MKILIIIPAYKEADNIERLVDDIILNHPICDYVIINDGSHDATRSICQRKGYNFIDLPINLGIGGAVQTGYKYAEREGYDIAIQIDGDGQHDVLYLDRVVQPLQNDQADVVIGSRFIVKEGFQSSSARRFGIRFLSILIHLCTGKKILDVTSGYRAVNRKFIEIYADSYPSDYPEPEAIVAAVMHRGRIKEVPVVMKERQTGISSIHAWKSVYYMIKVTLAIIVCRISFGIRR
jgi:hypothetical protein